MKGIYSMKTYVNPMLQVVSIKKSDIIATSTETLGIGNAYSGGTIQAGDRFRDWED